MLWLGRRCKMKFLFGADGMDFYWDPDTGSVMWKDSGKVLHYLGFAESPEEAKEVAILWL